MDLSGMMKQCHEEITTDTIGAVVAGSKQRGKFAALNSITVPELDELAISQIHLDEMRVDQMNDETIGEIMIFVKNNSYPDKDAKKQMNKEKKVLVNQWKKIRNQKEGGFSAKNKVQSSTCSSPMV